MREFGSLDPLSFIPDGINISDRPTGWSMPDHVLKLHAVALNVNTIITPVQLNNRTAVSKASSLSHKLLVIILHLKNIMLMVIRGQKLSK